MSQKWLGDTISRLTAIIDRTSLHCRYQATRPDLQKVLHPMLPPGRAIFMRRMKNKITAKEKAARDKAARKAARRERKAEQVALKKDRKAQVGAHEPCKHSTLTVVAGDLCQCLSDVMAEAGHQAACGDSLRWVRDGIPEVPSAGMAAPS